MLADSKFVKNVYAKKDWNKPDWWCFEQWSSKALDSANKGDMQDLAETLLKLRLTRLVGCHIA